MKLVVVDLENTISDSRHRMWLLGYGVDDASKKEHYDKFQEEFKYDKLNMNVKMFIDSLVRKGYTIVILTAKLEKYRVMVTNWLVENDVLFSSLVMKKKENISDLKFKENYIIVNQKLITFALDDVGSNCALFGKYNIPCLRIEQK